MKLDLREPQRGGRIGATVADQRDREAAEVTVVLETRELRKNERLSYAMRGPRSINGGDRERTKG